jgi:hypothetical protein
MCFERPDGRSILFRLSRQLESRVRTSARKQHDHDLIPRRGVACGCHPDHLVKVDPSRFAVTGFESNKLHDSVFPPA